MKDLILGLAAGMIAGAVLVKNCKACDKWVDEVTSMAKSKMKKAQSSMESKSQSMQSMNDGE